MVAPKVCLEGVFKFLQLEQVHPLIQFILTINVLHNIATSKVYAFRSHLLDLTIHVSILEFHSETVGGILQATWCRWTDLKYDVPVFKGGFLLLLLLLLVCC